MFFILSFGASAQQTIKADIGKTSVTYYMKHALHAWTGVSNDVNCIVQMNDKGDIEKVAATAKVRSFDSKNSNRDSHMMEVTDALTYPIISFYSTSIERNGSDLHVKGVLKFHGIEKPVTMQGKEVKNGSKRTITGEFVFLLEDFKIDRPSIFMVKTDNEVKVSFKVEL
jgi:polyisoprenoid-binding protein YceI